MINLETNLKNWVLTGNEELFEQEIYPYFKYLAAYICKKHNLKKDIDITINDLVSECSIKLPSKYNPEEGTAKCLCYVIMNQYLSNQARFNSQSKRDYKKLIYIEDLENTDEYHSSIIELELDIFTYYKSTLLERTDVLDKLNTKLTKSIYLEIIKCLNELPDEANYVNYIATKCKCSLKSVYNTLDLIRNLLSTNSSLKLLITT
jgi:hypothetical protein